MDSDVLIQVLTELGGTGAFIALVIYIFAKWWPERERRHHEHLSAQRRVHMEQLEAFDDRSSEERRDSRETIRSLGRSHERAIQQILLGMQHNPGHSPGNPENEDNKPINKGGQG